MDRNCVNILKVKNIDDKLKGVDALLQLAFDSASQSVQIPAVPGRDVTVCLMSQLPPKSKGLSLKEGQARLLHDLASIELQAMELGIRTLFEFSEAPLFFREQLVDVIRDEARHLKLCLQGLDKLGYAWGDWPVHIELWKAVSDEDSFLERLVIVHRYLEGSGLDASDKILRRLSGLQDQNVYSVVKTIAEEEIGHVQFGSYWFKETCRKEKKEGDETFRKILFHVRHKIPRRLEKLEREVRLKAGFSNNEIETLSLMRDYWLQSKNKTNVLNSVE